MSSISENHIHILNYLRKSTVKIQNCRTVYPRFSHINLTVKHFFKDLIEVTLENAALHQIWKTCSIIIAIVVTIILTLNIEH